MRWMGPYLVCSSNGQTVFVDLGERTGKRSFNIAQVKPLRLPFIAALMVPTIPAGPQNRSRSGDAQHQMASISPVTINASTFHGEVISPSDPQSARFDMEKKEELEGLLERGTFKVVLRSELEEDPNIVPSRFVLVIKHKATGERKRRARFVLGEISRQRKEESSA